MRFNNPAVLNHGSRCGGLRPPQTRHIVDSRRTTSAQILPLIAFLPPRSRWPENTWWSTGKGHFAEKSTAIPDSGGKCDCARKKRGLGGVGALWVGGSARKVLA